MQRQFNNVDNYFCVGYVLLGIAAAQFRHNHCYERSMPWLLGMSLYVLSIGIIGAGYRGGMKNFLTCSMFCGVSATLADIALEYVNKNNCNV